MPQSDPVVFAGAGFDRIHESDCVNARVVSQVAKLSAECRHRRHGEIGIRTTSSPGESKSAAGKINHPSRCGCRRH
jgi:hypothetical protein